MFDKTIVFCENIAHAQRMRQALVNENSDLVAENHKYVMQITGDEKEGKAELDNFIFPESKYPVIAVTSKLMTTGVDAQTCKLVVLDQRISSMTEFKQTIGRGTRINEDYDKFFFTIIDFKQATALFADPEFDGDPVQVYEPQGWEDSLVPPDEAGAADEGGDGSRTYPPGEETDPFAVSEGGEGGRVRRYVVDDVEVRVAVERVQYFDANGRLITESLKDYTRKMLTGEYASWNDFLNRWNRTDKKQAILEEMRQQGVFYEELAEEVGRDYDPFDLICHVVWDRPPLTRRERAEAVKKRDYFEKYGEQARQVLEALLEKYADEGMTQIEEPQILMVSPFTEIGTPVEIARAFGGRTAYSAALQELTQALYSA